GPAPRPRSVASEGPGHVRGRVLGRRPPARSGDGAALRGEVTAMRAARLHGRGDLRLHDEERPRPAAGATLGRGRAGGLWGWDVHWFTEGGIGGVGPPARPFVLGHEFGGLTEDGRAVAVDPALPCGGCAPCREGHFNLCERTRFAGDGA